MWQRLKRVLHISAVDASPQDIKIFTSLIRECAAQRDLSKATDTHNKILHSRHCTNTFLANLMIDMYTKCGSLEHTKRVFDDISFPNTYSWNAMLSAYAQFRHLQQAIDLFNRMPDRDAVSWNIMIKAYAQNGHLQGAKFCFDSMLSRNVISWTAILVAYAQDGHMDGAQAIYIRMPRHDAVAGNAMLTAYAQTGHINSAIETFQNIVYKDILSWNLMLQAYGANSKPDEAMSLFNTMPIRNVVSWNAILATYAQKGQIQQASRIFTMMPHTELASWNTMMAAFANHGHVASVKDVFESMPEQDVISWNTVIAAFAEGGSYKTGLEHFAYMNLEGFFPTGNTFIGLLIGCNRGGKVKKAHELFISMTTLYGLLPESDHYGCMVEVLGRAKQLEEAEELIHTMPFFPGTVVWTSYLSSCRMHGNFERAARAAERLIELDPENESLYLLLSNMYSEKAISKQQDQCIPSTVSNIELESSV